MLKAMAWILVFMGVVVSGVELQQMVDGDGDNVVFGFVLATFFLGSGILLLRRIARRQRLRGAGDQAAADLPLDARIFRMAQQSAGRITAVEVSAAIGVPFETASEALASLEERRACQLLITDDGVSVYRFPEFETASSKRDLMELADES